MIEFVIINYNTYQLTCKCIESIYRHYGTANVVVVDNASTDDSVSQINIHYPESKVIVNSENFGYAKAVNIGVRATKSELVIVCNSDVEFLGNSVQITEDMMANDTTIGISGFNQLYPDLRPQRSYGLFPGYRLGLMDMFLLSSIWDKLSILIKKYNLFQSKIIFPQYVDGASLMIRRSVFDSLNGFDEDYFFYTEEADYCKRVWQNNKKVAINLRSKIIHIRGAGRKKDDFNEKAENLLISTKLLFLRKHGTIRELNFFKFSQRTYFLNISVIEYLLSVILFNDNIRYKSKEHLRLYKLWKSA